MYKHKVLEHKKEDKRIKIQITKNFRDPLTRQANEGVRINGRSKNELLNSKTEYNHPPILRITVDRKTFLKKKSTKMYDSINELNPNTTPVIQGPSSDSSLSGTEVVFNHRC